jgi:exosortase/archaeosortase family protein
MDVKETIDLISRYLLLAILPLGGLYIFYSIFTPLTVYPAYFAFSKLYGAKLLTGNVIFFKGYYAEIVQACVAGAAYYLLAILNLTTPMHIKKRIKSLLFIAVSFLIINIIRIIIFGMLFSKGYQYFDVAHELVWYFGSTIIVVVVWFANVWLFKVKAIPIYTDMMHLFTDITSGQEVEDKQEIKSINKTKRASK